MPGQNPEDKYSDEFVRQSASNALFSDEKRQELIQKIKDNPPSTSSKEEKEKRIQEFIDAEMSLEEELANVELEEGDTVAYITDSEFSIATVDRVYISDTFFNEILVKLAFQDNTQMGVSIENIYSEEEAIKYIKKQFNKN